MSVKNTLELNSTCPYCRCKSTVNADLDFGVIQGHVYHVGDQFFWDDKHETNTGLYDGEGYVVCPCCHRDYWIIVRIVEDTIVAACVDYARKGIIDGPWVENVKTDQEHKLIDELVTQLHSDKEGDKAAALEVLRTSEWLMDGSLRGIDLTGGTLSGYDLFYADLQGANLHKANLEGAKLIWANLKWAKLDETNLASANLFQSNGRGAFFKGAILHKATLDGSNFQGANLDNCKATEIHCGHVNLTNASFIESDLRNGWFSGSDFSGANLSGANLTGCALLHTKFSGANLRDVQLQNADMLSADLTHATNLDTQQLVTARGLLGTIMPNGFNYDGRFNLPMDLQMAERHGYDPHNPEGMAQFYKVSLQDYLNGQNAQ